MVEVTKEARRLLSQYTCVRQMGTTVFAPLNRKKDRFSCGLTLHPICLKGNPRPVDFP